MKKIKELEMEIQTLKQQIKQLEEDLDIAKQNSSAS